MSHPSSLPAGETSTPRTTSLAAAAAMNAGLQRESTLEESTSRRGSLRSAQDGSPNLVPRSSIERQRNSIAMNLNLNDPALPAAGEMQASSPVQARTPSRAFQNPPVRSAESRSRDSSIANVHRGRQPSVGEVYQEMEQEQEAQVNRLLQTIRLQQNQIQVLQARSGSESSQPDGISENNPFFAASAGDPIVPQSPVLTSERSRRLSQISPAPVRSIPTGYQLSQSLSHEQENAIINSGRATPALPTPASSVSGATKDEVAFYQAENQSLNRENQLLRARIQELEQQLPGSQNSTTNTGIPIHSSRLAHEQQVDEDVAPDEAK